MAQVAVCSEIRTKHSTQSERRVEFLKCLTWWYVTKLLGFERLKRSGICTYHCALKLNNSELCYTACCVIRYHSQNKQQIFPSTSLLANFCNGQAQCVYCGRGQEIETRFR